MLRFGDKVDKIYRRIGDRGVVFIIFLVGVLVHTVFALQMEMMSVDPNEFGVAAWAALFAGKNWSGVMSKIGFYYGYAGSIIYTPVILLFKDPFIQYKMMLLLNGIVVSFVPPIAYRIAHMLKVEKAWQRVLVAIACGIYSTNFAHTKFIWNETSCIIFPWLILYLIIKTGDVKSRTQKYCFSVLTAFVSVVAVCAHPRLISVSISAFIIILFARFFAKRKLVYLSGYLPALAVFAVLGILLSGYLKGIMWQDSGILLENTFQNEILSVNQFFTLEGIKQFVQTFFGHLYYFATSTWGLGALAICLVFILVKSFICEQQKKPVEQSYDMHIVLFALYGFLSNFIAMLISCFEKFSSPGFSQYQDTLIFGRYMDSVIPLLIMLVICYVFVYSLDFIKLLGTIIVLGGIYTGFFCFTAPVIVQAGETRVSPILGLYPIRIGEQVNALITMDGLFLTVSSVFCFIALYIVIVCCSKHYRKHIISISMIALMLYSSMYTAIVYLPFVTADVKVKHQPIYDLSNYVYNSADSPEVCVYKLPRRTSTVLQFLNQDTKINVMASLEEIPEHCYIIVPNEDRVTLRPGSEHAFQELGQTELYTIYAYGERAVAFAHSQEPADEREKAQTTSNA